MSTRSRRRAGDVPEVVELAALGPLLIAADDVGLWAALRGRPRSARGLARALALDGRALAAVLDALAAVGLVERRAGGYALSLAAARLDGQIPGGLRHMFALWRAVPRFLKRGEPARRMDGDASHRARAYAGSVGALERWFQGAARALAGALGPVRGGGRVLDVGAGAGTWSLPMLRGAPDVHVTALDLPAVLAVFRARALAAGGSRRVTAVGADFHRFDFEGEGPWDRILLGNVLHLETPSSAAALVRACGRGLAPGGELVVVDAFPGPSVRAQRAHAFYALHLALRTRRGAAHPASQVRSWMAGAGVERVRALLLAPDRASITALVGRKPRA